jgi:fucose permease
MGIAATVAVIIGESLLQSRRPMEVVEATDQPGHESSGPPGRARISIAFPYIVITIVWIVVIWFKLISPAG